jgi:hypothetical protein
MSRRESENEEEDSESEEDRKSQSENSKEKEIIEASFDPKKYVRERSFKEEKKIAENSEPGSLPQDLESHESDVPNGMIKLKDIKIRKKRKNLSNCLERFKRAIFNQRVNHREKQEKLRDILKQWLKSDTWKLE